MINHKEYRKAVKRVQELEGTDGRHAQYELSLLMDKICLFRASLGGSGVSAPQNRDRRVESNPRRFCTVEPDPGF